MNYFRNLLILILAGTTLNSCLITEDIRSLQIEIMKPGVISIPDSLNRVALVNRAALLSDSSFFTYYSGLKIRVDMAIKYRELSNTCIDALAGYFGEKGYFGTVNNYRDSIKRIQPTNSMPVSPDELFHLTSSDIILSLDQFTFNQTIINDSENLFYTIAYLSWTIAFKTDTLSYRYNQVDTLIYEAPYFTDFKTNSKNTGHKLMLVNASEYLGRFFGAKIIPDWLQVERMYYKSKNPIMLAAEKYAFQNQWLKAAELWNRETKNKNLRIVAKACFNMALAAEMEGQHDVAIDWLVKSYTALPKNNGEHKANCQRYIRVLAIRKKEIERLEKQIRIPEKISMSD